MAELRLFCDNCLNKVINTEYQKLFQRSKILINIIPDYLQCSDRRLYQYNKKFWLVRFFQITSLQVIRKAFLIDSFSWLLCLCVSMLFNLIEIKIEIESRLHCIELVTYHWIRDLTCSCLFSSICYKHTLSFIILIKYSRHYWFYSTAKHSTTSIIA